MKDYRADTFRRPYLLLFNAATDAVRAIEKYNYGKARDILNQAQQDAEELYLSANDSGE